MAEREAAQSKNEENRRWAGNGRKGNEGDEGKGMRGKGMKGIKGIQRRKGIKGIVFLCVFIGCLILVFPRLPAKRPPAEQISTSEDFRPRTIVTTDGECDDLNSFLHLLLCANDLDLRGLVLTSSCYHYAGDEKREIAPYRWGGEAWMQEYILAYAKVYKNLAARDPRYPSPERLMELIRVGNIKTASDMEEATEGSRLIQEEILREESSRLYLQCWGGSNTVARALMDVSEALKEDPDWEEKKAKISGRLVLYMIGTQDDTYENYIKGAWPEVTVLHNKGSFEALAFNWKAVLDPDQTKTLEARWQLKNILDPENPLLKLYYTYWDDRAYEGELSRYQYGLKSFHPLRIWRFLTYHGGWFDYGDFLSEGDSPAFLFLLDHRLKTAESFEIDNWGGRFVRVSEHIYEDSFKPAQGVGRYVTAIEEDFARRVRWTLEGSLSSLL